MARVPTEFRKDAEGLTNIPFTVTRRKAGFYSYKVRVMAREANKRLAQLEESGYTGNSVPYQRVQAEFIRLGRKKSRFPTSGQMTDYNALLHMEKLLRQFLESKTSSVDGINQFENDIWEGAKKAMSGLESLMTQDEYLDLWKNLPTDKKARMFSSGLSLAMVSAWRQKKGRRRTIDEVANILQHSRTEKSAMRKLGLSLAEVERHRKALKGE